MHDRPVTILLVDDVAADVSLLRSLLDYRWDGRFRLIHVEDLATGLSLAASERPDVVLLDLSLPDSQGLGAFLQLYARVPHVPIVLLSRNDDELLAMKAVQAGAQDYLVKTQLNEQLLVRSLRYAIERAGRENAEETLRMNAAQLRVARDIQRSLFPARAPVVEGFEISGVSYPADETGGDFFDYVDMLDGTLGIVVADVSSHGLGSALLMAETRAYFRALALSYEDVGDILTRANRILFADTEGKHFVTAFFAKLDPRARTLTYAAAGHAGYWIEASGATTRLDGTSLPLGIEREMVVPVAPTVTLRPGDVAFICTDGIQEAHSPAREMFGSRRALETVRRHLGQSADEIVRGLYDAVTKHTAGRPPNDDITAVAVKRI